ncbi:hypothetical protein DQ384_05510 [Sphaerisporangium album]|uniref:Uncharacterized protein n=1 Tax=Sphaerisporangium album TaxID=509200 RepID=A0A367FQN4_9ACTN|nr:hypothetical protein [Sphaerisporangium album]RCG32000.1 hypothetical protein DQ384_05510 [Sphaerisporangium album]
MAEEWTIAEVRLSPATQYEVGPDRTLQEVAADRWDIDLDTPQGRITHFLPVSTVAWRIAEYGLDPADPQHVAQALDMALHEPHIPPPDQPPPQASAVVVWTPQGVVEQPTPAAQPQATATAAGNAEMTLMTAASLDDARQAHLARIEAAKERVRVVSPVPRASTARAGLRRTAPAAPCPLEWMRGHAASCLDVEDVEAKRKLVEQARAAYAAHHAAPSAPSDQPSAVDEVPVLRDG